MITAVLISLLASDTCSACSLADGQVHLCAAHESEQRLVLPKESRHLQAKEEADRITALDALAALTQSHTNAPSEAVVDAIASALKDDSYIVRKHATSLLGRPQNATRVLLALSNALGAAEAERMDLERVKEKTLARLLDVRRRHKSGDELAEELEKCRTRLDVVSDWRDAILDQLAAIPDDRSVAAICSQLPRDLVNGGSKALLRLGSRSALMAVVDGLEAWEGRLAELQKTIAEPKDDPKAPGNQRTSLGMTFDEFEYEKVRLPGLVVLTSLNSLFLKKGIMSPGLEAGKGDAWRTLIEEHAELVPEHLPGIPSVAWQ